MRNLQKRPQRHRLAPDDELRASAFHNVGVACDGAERLRDRLAALWVANSLRHHLAPDDVVRLNLAESDLKAAIADVGGTVSHGKVRFRLDERDTIRISTGGVR